MRGRTSLASLESPAVSKFNFYANARFNLFLSFAQPSCLLSLLNLGLSRFGVSSADLASPGVVVFCVDRQCCGVRLNERWVEGERGVSTI